MNIKVKRKESTVRLWLSEEELGLLRHVSEKYVNGRGLASVVRELALAEIQRRWKLTPVTFALLDPIYRDSKEILTQQSAALRRENVKLKSRMRSLERLLQAHGIEPDEVKAL